ncbi:MAG: alpha/beta hydrolase [Myxococcales bacterium]|nr:alpha/beta hydrolase [Myxococcales bacterium]
MMNRLVSFVPLSIVFTMGLAACNPSDVTVVLVHGSWHTPEATWAPLTTQLDAAQISWESVDLATSGDELVGLDPLKLPGLADDVSLARDTIEAVDGPVLLVGHSYGGMVISEAGLDEQVEHLMYLCAFSPAEGESLVDVATSVEVTDLPVLGDPKAILFDYATGLSRINPDFAVAALVADLPEAEAQAAVDALVPSVGAASVEPAGPVAWTDVDSTYVVCSQDEAIPPVLQRALSTKIGAVTSELDTSHSAALSDPVGVARVIEDALAAISGS